MQQGYLDIEVPFLAIGVPAGQIADYCGGF
jgi:hypothetical protein